MSSGRWVRAVAVKETRGLLMPLFFIVASAVLISLTRQEHLRFYLLRLLRDLDVPLLLVSPMLLGAVAMGIELQSGELSPMWIAQPAPRRGLVFAKLLILAAALAAWSFAANWLLVESLNTITIRGFFAEWPLLGPCLFGLGVAPALTLFARNWTTGFAMTLAAWIIASLIGTAVGGFSYGPSLEAQVRASDISRAVFWCLSVFLAGAGLWTTVFLLERGLPSRRYAWRRLALRRQPSESRARTNRARQVALVVLVKKELRLQRPMLAVAGVYAVVWLAMTALSYVVAPNMWPPTDLLTLVYVFIVVAGVAARASAVERSLGLSEGQALLPLGAGLQWTTKVVTAVGLAVALGIELPYLLFLAWPHGTIGGHMGPLMPIQTMAPGNMMVLTSYLAGALFVSSVFSSPWLAAVASWPSVLTSILIYSQAGEFTQMVVKWLDPLQIERINVPFTTHPAPSWLMAIGSSPSLSFLTMVGPASILALWFGRRNHFSAERGAIRAWKQAGWLALAVAVPAVVMSLAWIYLRKI